MVKRLLTLSLVAALTSLAGNAKADIANVVPNGDFSSGLLNPWIIDHGTATIVNLGSNQHGLLLNDSDETGVYSGNFTLQNGLTYTLTYQTQNSGNGDWFSSVVSGNAYNYNYYNSMWNGQVTPNTPPVSGTRIFSQQFIADGSINQIYFSYSGTSSGTLSSVSILADTAVPEPSALSLLAVGLGGLALVRRRRS